MAFHWGVCLATLRERIRCGVRRSSRRRARSRTIVSRKAAVCPVRWIAMSSEPSQRAIEREGVAAPDTADAADLTPILGANLRRLRIRRGLSLERLAKASGVSRAMLGQIELGQSTPTINVVWKIARALAVPFSALISQQRRPRTALLSAARAKGLASADGTFTSRALFPLDGGRKVDFYELHLRAHGR